ncbi:MAG: ABC transporter permease, partial [Lachnospiraceae bacterium]|nr:ABC transporter permease [Lachnospiraceae bacterium]
MLIFIILASMFVASSANNMITVATALDDYFAMAEVPDYWYVTTYQEEAERFAVFAKDNGYGLKITTLTQIDPKNVSISGEKFSYGNLACLSMVGGIKVFDENENEITHVNDGEIYIPYDIFSSKENDFYNGCKIVIDTGSIKKEFTLKSYTKDAIFGSSMMGMTRFLVSENDYKLFDSPDASIFYELYVYTDDTAFTEKLNDFDLKSINTADRSVMKLMYMMDILTAAVILIVSICLILISMVILRFTINFTMNAEFREIGVMKAIGISNSKIRTLYIVKYFAISTVGTIIGLALSVPFGNLLIESVSRNIILSGRNKFYLNVIFAIATTAIVVLFCYLCTGKIKQFSPIDAIRSGETGERYTKKSIIRLNKSRISPIAFM